MRRPFCQALLAASALTFLASGAHAAQCHSMEMSFQELVYIDKEDLEAEYCAASRFADMHQKHANETTNISLRMQTTDKLQACANYMLQIGRILRKDHGYQPKQDVNCR